MQKMTGSSGRRQLVALGSIQCKQGVMFASRIHIGTEARSIREHMVHKSRSEVKTFNATFTNSLSSIRHLVSRSFPPFLFSSEYSNQGCVQSSLEASGVSIRHPIPSPSRSTHDLVASLRGLTKWPAERGVIRLLDTLQTLLLSRVTHTGNRLSLTIVTFVCFGNKPTAWNFISLSFICMATPIKKRIT